MHYCVHLVAEPLVDIGLRTACHLVCEQRVETNVNRSVYNRNQIVEHPMPYNVI